MRPPGSTLFSAPTEVALTIMLSFPSSLGGAAGCMFFALQQENKMTCTKYSDNVCTLKCLCYPTLLLFCIQVRCEPGIIPKKKENANKCEQDVWVNRISVRRPGLLVDWVGRWGFACLSYSKSAPRRTRELPDSDGYSPTSTRTFQTSTPILPPLKCHHVPTAKHQYRASSIRASSYTRAGSLSFRCQLPAACYNLSCFWLRRTGYTHTCQHTLLSDRNWEQN